MSSWIVDISWLLFLAKILTKKNCLNCLAVLFQLFVQLTYIYIQQAFW